jgi:hypothetical protein
MTLNLAMLLLRGEWLGNVLPRSAPDENYQRATAGHAVVLPMTREHSCIGGIISTEPSWWVVAGFEL